ncbi:MAG: hypothetical protein N2490_03035 [Ignavibacteria bacterium]|nr:hypothetical protein [Ignavibacteria bacterium]
MKRLIHIFIIINFALLNINFSFSQYEKVQSDRYAISINYTPVFSIPDLYSIFGGEDGSTLKLDSRGVTYGFEYVAFPNTIFEIKDAFRIKNSIIYKVISENSPYKTSNYYIDSRFVKTTNKKPDILKKDSLNKEIIIERLKSRVGTPYLFGGIFAFGFPELLEFYPPADELSDEIKQKWTLTGVDCSGLLYDVTERFTPRSSKELLQFGDSVDIEGKDLDEIINLLRPLDIIGYVGHTFYVLDNNYIVESSPNRGVHLVEIEKRLRWLLKERIPVNSLNSCPENSKCFVIRRWFK